MTEVIDTQLATNNKLATVSLSICDAVIGATEGVVATTIIPTTIRKVGESTPPNNLSIDESYFQYSSQAMTPRDLGRFTGFIATAGVVGAVIASEPNYCVALAVTAAISGAYEVVRYIINRT